MRDASDFLLKLASTYELLRDGWEYFGKGRIPALEETRRRKPLKATEERLGRAFDLLESLGLKG